MISVYYFWGELFKLQKAKRMSPEEIEAVSGGKLRLGVAIESSSIVTHSMFTYHGNETTVPSREIAMVFVDKFPLTRGMPGPSFLW